MMMAPRFLLLWLACVECAFGFSAPSRRVLLANGGAVALGGLAGEHRVSAATESELKSMLGDTQKELAEGPPKKKKAVQEKEASSGGGVGLPDFGSLSEKAKAEGRARAQARKEALTVSPAPVTKKATTSEDSGSSAGVYNELRAKRQAQKEAAEQKSAARKKNLTPMEEFKMRK